MKRALLIFVTRLVFSQSLISLDLIEDFLELSCKDEDDEDAKPSPYKGSFLSFLVQSFLNLMNQNIFLDLQFRVSIPAPCLILSIWNLNHQFVCFYEVMFF